MVTEQEAREIAKRLLREMDEEARNPELRKQRKKEWYPWVGMLPAYVERQAKKEEVGEQE